MCLKRCDSYNIEGSAGSHDKVEKCWHILAILVGHLFDFVMLQRRAHRARRPVSRVEE